MPTQALGAQQRPAQKQQSTRPDTQQLPIEELERRSHDQWFYARVFEDLHMYFLQKNAIEYTNPLTKKEWKTTPPIEMKIGGRSITVVAAVPSDNYSLSPISFFDNRCDGIPVGCLVATDVFDNNSEMRYAVQGVTHAGVDFSNATGDELHVFADNLTQYLLNNPTKTIVDKIVEPLGSAAKLAADKVVDLADEGWDRGIFQVVGAVGCIAGAITGAVWGAGKLDLFSPGESSFYATQKDLPVAAAINPNLNSFSNVQVMSDAELKQLAGADIITSLDEIEFSGSELETEFEAQLQSENNIGKIYQAQIPADGHCNLVQTFNVPNGTVRMVESKGAPSLVVRVKHVKGVSEYAKYYGDIRVPIDESDEVPEDLFQAQVCNPAEADSMATPIPADAKAYIEITKLAPAEFGVGR